MGTPPVWLPLLVLLPSLAFWAYCLYDFANTPTREIRTYPRQVWLVLLVLGSVLGGIAWFVLGRPERPRRS